MHRSQGLAPKSDLEGTLVGSSELGLDEPPRYLEAERIYRDTAYGCRVTGDTVGEGRALLAVAWALEKQGQGRAALEIVDDAERLLRTGDDLKKLAECYHSSAVWRFHHFDGQPPIDEFTRAIETRLRSGDLLGAAQSWHNLGYVQLIAGQADDAETSYKEATELLDQIRTGSDHDAAEFAFRQLGFVLSHRAFAAALHQPLRDALRATLAYFQHVAQTGAHREPVLAYLAPGVALAGSRVVPEEESRALEALVGLAPLAETWLRVAVREASLAMTTHTETGTGRRAYLGSHLLALAQLGQWCVENDQHKEAARHWAKARKLALARGWLGEASRVERRSVEARGLST